MTAFLVIIFAQTNILLSNQFIFLHILFKHKLIGRGNTLLPPLPTSQAHNAWEEQLLNKALTNQGDFLKETDRSPPLMTPLSDL